MTTPSPLDAALSYARQIHEGQIRRKTGMPRLAHLLVVAGTVLEHGGVEEEAIAALLHDAVEDAGGIPRLEDIELRFGSTVAKIVAGCTQPETTPKLPWQERKQAYIDQLAAASASVHLVSAADKLHNARALCRDLSLEGESLWRRYRGGKEGTLWYYRTLVALFNRTGPPRLAEELARTFQRIQQLVRGSPLTD